MKRQAYQHPNAEVIRVDSEKLVALSIPVHEETDDSTIDTPDDAWSNHKNEWNSENWSESPWND